MRRHLPRRTRAGPTVGDDLGLPANPPMDASVTLTAPYAFASADTFQLLFPQLGELHYQMFRIISKVAAEFAVDFKDYQLQMPTGGAA